eukprot:1354215-Amorphochlora_amoeboformis.AAC.1
MPCRRGGSLWVVSWIGESERGRERREHVPARGQRETERERERERSERSGKSERSASEKERRET